MLKYVLVCFLWIGTLALVGEELSLEEWAKEGLFVYHSDQAIATVENLSNERIYIRNVHISLPAWGFYIFPQPVYKLEVYASPNGSLKIGHLSGLHKEQVKKYMWKAIKPFLMPDTHPIKSQLDRIFSKRRILGGRESAKRAGFILTTHYKGHRSILRHPALKGYIFKVYFDKQNEEDWPHWVERCRGAAVVRNAIKANRLENIFTVPKKWIYALPSQGPKAKGKYPKNFILVAEESLLIPPKQNLELFKEMTSKSLLKAIYTMIRDTGLSDGARPDNLCFTKDNKLAFIDTELYHHPKPDYHHLDRYLSLEMRKAWIRLVAEERKQN